MSTITDKLVLPQDISILQADAFPAAIRTQLDYKPGDSIISRPRSRMPSCVIDGQLAAFMERFRRPKTIVQAVIEHARESALDTEQTLVALVPALERMLSARWLIPHDAADAGAINPRYQAGEKLGQYTIVRCIQSVTDTDVYQAAGEDGAAVAIKLLRPEADATARSLFANEVRVLQRMDSSNCAVLREHDVTKDYLVLAWSSGRPLIEAANELRVTGMPRTRLLRMAVNLLDAFSALHAQGCMHGDVHVNNLLADRKDDITIIDFGYAHFLDELSEGPYLRGGSPNFYDPEHAAAKLHGKRPPRLTTWSEQYSLAVCCYYIFTGKPYLAFSLKADEALRQICDEPPLPFERTSGRSWPDVEDVLCRAFSKVPAQRYASVAEFASALREILNRSEPVIRIRMSRDTFQRARDTFVAQVDIDGVWLRSGFPTTPLCGASQGASGVAYALYRLACLQSDARLLSLASLWSRWSLAQSQSPSAFYSEERGITPAIVSPVSMYLMPPGMYLVHALIHHALDDQGTAQSAVRNFVDSSRREAENLDVVLGHSGVLLGCTLLYEVFRGHAAIDIDPVFRFAQEELEFIWKRLAPLSLHEKNVPASTLPVAHGWAGFLYSILRFCEAASLVPPDGLEDKLQQLADCAHTDAKSMSWPVRAAAQEASTQPDLANWCNGSAGFIYLWIAAHRLFQQSRYLDCAIKSARHVWENPAKIDSVCCGTSGQAYGLLTLGRYLGETRWRQCALDRIALHPRAHAPAPPTSLYQGDVGTLLAQQEFLTPEQARFPLFEEEGWSDETRTDEKIPPRRITRAHKARL